MRSNLQGAEDAKKTDSDGISQFLLGVLGDLAVVTEDSRFGTLYARIVPGTAAFVLALRYPQEAMASAVPGSCRTGEYAFVGVDGNKILVWNTSSGESKRYEGVTPWDPEKRSGVLDKWAALPVQ